MNLFSDNQRISNSHSKIGPMERAEYRGQTCLHFVEAMPIAAGRAGRGALKQSNDLLSERIILLRHSAPPPLS